MSVDTDTDASVPPHRSIVLLLFLQKQNLATSIYLFGLGTLLTGLGLKHMQIRSHHDLAGALVTDDRPFIVLTETKFSFHCIPVGISTLLTGLGSKKEHM